MNNESDYNMYLEFLQREIIRDLEEIHWYKQQLSEISISCAHLPVGLRPTPLRRDCRINFYVKQYRSYPMYNKEWESQVISRKLSKTIQVSSEI
jgi:hypothetical protein